MGSATLCFSGFPRDELTLLHEQFEQANRELDAGWTLVPEVDAHVLVIDMDSMYGHMSWLKAHGGGKTTIGLTTGDRSETDYLLKRPLSTVDLKGLLEQVALRPTASESVPAAPLAASDYSPSPNEYLAAVTTARMTAVPEGIVHEPRVSDYLSPGTLGGPAKLQLAGAPVIAFDPASQTYAGSATLKPLLPYVESVIREFQVEAIEMAEFERIKAGSGGAQPYMRLLWFCGISIASGDLLPGHSPAKKYLLSKWPQIEREFPKHFRLATVMMKGPALVKDIAELSGVSAAEVVAFINAGLLTGAVVVEGATPAAGDVARAVALLARPRAS